MFGMLNHALEYYRDLETNSGNKFFEHQMSSEERTFYKSLLGFAWTWTRLIVLKHSAYNVE